MKIVDFSYFYWEKLCLAWLKLALKCVFAVNDIEQKKHALQAKRRGKKQNKWNYFNKQYEFFISI